jgi:hypothetical protein
LRWIGPVCAARGLVERWCDVAVGAGEPALTCSALNKTELLLAGVGERADLYPLGDLYASELAVFTEPALSDRVAGLAEAAGGLAELDAALRRLFDERRDAAAAFAAIPQLREQVLERLRETRFRRTQAGIIPKLGARTIGIDLFT